ncbi:MAG: hypothetical protein DRP09_13055 [Candidatus Thorarchaeota archaeon]|nr:MAG: hypothetical protein DRP09_13055 [Candidatus Thorarchaeota archaeon]
MRYEIPKYQIDTVNQTLTDTYQTIMEFTGSGWLEYFEINFSDAGWAVKLVIDGIDSIEISEEEVSTFDFINVDTAAVKGNLFIKNTGKDFFFQPSRSIYFKQSVVIKAKRANTETPNVNRVLLHYTEEFEQ